MGSFSQRNLQGTLFSPSVFLNFLFFLAALSAVTMPWSRVQGLTCFLYLAVIHDPRSGRFPGGPNHLFIFVFCFQQKAQGFLLQLVGRNPCLESATCQPLLSSGFVFQRCLKMKIFPRCTSYLPSLKILKHGFSKIMPFSELAFSWVVY